MGYFELIARSDVFVFLDSVQFEKQSWQSRNRIRTRKGDIQWLSVPIAKAPLDTAISEIEIAPNPPGWKEKQYKTILTHLRTAPHFSEVEQMLEGHFQGSQSHLADLNISFISTVARELGIDTELVRSSRLTSEGKKADLLLNLCEELGADHYYSNAGSAVYLEAERERFESNGIELEFQDWTHPVYDQLGRGFVSHLAVIDGLSCMGWDRCRELIFAG